MLAQALVRAIRAARSWTDPTPLERALRQLSEPWTVAVVGRVGAGKSTLVSWLSGDRRPTGLGGVTRAVEPVPAGELVLVDTPGIDDPDAALLGLHVVLDQADAAIWVVDGLQPATASERHVLAHALPPGRPLWVVVSKADLVDPAELPQVLERVRALAARHAPVAVRAVDLRTASRTGLEPQGLGRPLDLGERRRAAVLDAVARVRAALPPPPADDPTLEARWRAGVKEATAGIEARIAAGELAHKTDALLALGDAAPAVIAALAEAALPGAPPPLPRPAPPDDAPIAQVLAGMAGAEGARRVLLAEAARWLAEGLVVLRDRWPGDEPRVRAVASRRALDEALGVVEAETRVPGSADAG